MLACAIRALLSDDGLSGNDPLGLKNRVIGNFELLAALYQTPLREGLRRVVRIGGWHYRFRVADKPLETPKAIFQRSTTDSTCCRQLIRNFR
jgi:hypothetical protein